MNSAWAARPKRLRSFRLVLLLLLALGPAGNSSAEVRPHRFLDGEAFAFYLTPWILENTDRRQRLRNSFRPLAHFRFYFGAPFHFSSYPPRRKLKEWMLSREDNSISPDQLYRKAIELAGGRVEAGMILAWDVLREGWAEDNRNDFPHIRKLADITGERELFHGNDHLITFRSGWFKGFQRGVKTIRGDNFSAWYHFAGMALRAFLTQNNALSPISGLTHASLLAYLEERVLHDEFIDPEKRDLFNRQGAIFGDRLARLLARFRNPEALQAAVKETRKRYLYDDPSRYSESYALRPGEQSTDYYHRCPRSLILLGVKHVLAPWIPAVPITIGIEYARNKRFRDVFNRRFLGIGAR